MINTGCNSFCRVLHYYWTTLEMNSPSWGSQTQSQHRPQLPYKIVKKRRSTPFGDLNLFCEQLTLIYKFVLQLTFGNKYAKVSIQPTLPVHKHNTTVKLMDRSRHSEWVMTSRHHDVDGVSDTDCVHVLVHRTQSCYLYSYELPSHKIYCYNTKWTETIWYSPTSQ